MNSFDNVKFLGTFRSCQQRVLDNSDSYLKNNKIHIVAAPGSGKTILGLELIRRLNSPCLVLSPTNTIKFQWGERFEEMYIPKGENVDNYVSFDLKNIRPITSITYQALHSAIDKVVCEDEDGEIVDYSNIDVFNMLELHDIKTICVDEAHHLQNKWQKALEKFISHLNSDVKIIALTATPPYDASTAEWNRYIKICGDIDEEIYVTELVKAKNLCPHQDYVYLNYPTLEESEYFKSHYNNVNSCFEDLKKFQPLIKLGENIFKNRADKFILKERENFNNILGLLCYLSIPFDENLSSKILKQKEFDSSLEVCENALNYLLSNDVILSQDGIKKLRTLLKKYGLIEDDKVKLILNSKLEKTITYSLGKLESINKIVNCESNSLKDNLRMLILSDYIRKNDLAKVGTNKLFKDISVVSIFETIRRQYPTSKLGILSGGLAVLPNHLEDNIKSMISHKKGAVKIIPLGDTGHSEYVFNLSNKEKVKIVGKLFEDGLINILVGTKSLLGEGWDSPCINSLILASFVGSFMLSNQMRGRAIRVYKKDVNKTANIWHLVTLNPDFCDENNILMTEKTSNDYKILKRRFECFVGPHYENNSIQNGINRISILKDKMTYNDIENINNQMQILATNREQMSNKWFESTTKGDSKLYVETSIPKEAISGDISLLSLPNALVSCALLMLSLLGVYKYSLTGLLLILCKIGIVLFSITTLSYFFKFLTLVFKKNFVRMVSKAILRSMKFGNIITNKSKLKVRNNFRSRSIDVLLINESMKEQNVYSDAISEFFTNPQDARYLIVKKFYFKDIYRYSFRVPKQLAKNKFLAFIFSLNLPMFRSFKLYYTKNNSHVVNKCRIYSYLAFGIRPITKRQNSIK